MKIFPETKYLIDLKNESSKTLSDLQNETLSDEQFIVEWNKIFIGKINQNSFEIKLAKKIFGSFCIIKGKLDNKNGILEIQISKIYKLLLGALILFVISGLIISLIRSELENALRIILFILTLRFVFIEFLFRLNSKNSMNKLTKVIGIIKQEKNKAQ
ncbi:hypothetical protein CJ739_3883 [Mariniflexile rhizosphaerae]|uniref:hypothetical protein n=1 Tax=unclassified Mariniflexile TaxID=2643887 RepID=UPI000E3318F9|nr:hypothetical protein [Mariniflexile sp. TRM1-10]AXP82929.1 hypothetical protein CJ739_3870 [Mariniflexile sp. TRM1-10]AXP82942.1 hypothetical protein CJ739_3883 [Mariniflexile sp. TRM1-10]